MIPKSEYYCDCIHYSYITKDLFHQHHSQEEWEHFGQWMRGQSCPIISGNKIAFYSWDYECWVSQGRLRVKIK